MMKHRSVAIALALGLGILTASGCGSSASSTGTFVPGGGASSTAAATQSASPSASEALSFVMPTFGKNAHIVMTSWLPRNAAQAKAVVVDKDFELAYLYSEYTGGKDNSWSNYVSNSLVSELQSALAQPSVTTESFDGTIRFFRMSVTSDPAVHGDLDVSACFDNANSSNTNLKTGKVIYDNTPANDHYYRITDQLAKDSSGQWQVVANLPAIYYPRAKECKP